MFFFPNAGRTLWQDWPLLKRMMTFIRPYLRHLALALVLVLASIVSTNLLPVLVKVAIDNYLVASETLSMSSRMAGLWRLAGFYVLVAGFGFAIRYGQTYLTSWVGQHMMYDLRYAVFDKIMRLPFAFFDRHPVGGLMTRVTSDVASMQLALTDGAVALVADLFALLGIMGFMIYVNPPLAFILFLVFPVLFVVISYINFRIRAAHRRVRKQQSTLNAFLQEMLTGMLTVQLFNREDHARARFTEHNQELEKAYLHSIHWLSYFFPSVEVLRNGTTAVLLAVGGLMMLSGTAGMTAGVLVAFLMYIRDLFRPMEDLSEKANNLQSALASAERIFALLDTPESIRDPEHPEEITSFRGEVEFDHVWFAYQDEDWVLRNVNFRIAPAESIALVGATGAGKTSVASLLARFYDVQRGAIRVDGHDIRNLRQSDLRKRIGIVLQDPFIFSGTIHSNISLHNPDISREEVVQAARYVNADPFIRALPHGYETEVHERGVELSTGQKQLLALARALAQNPDILLILDEATANVDTETELLIQDALEKLMHGRTSIIIAHRLSTIQHVDRILVIRRGEFIEQGSHAELIQRDGYYKRLYDLLFHSLPS